MPPIVTVFPSSSIVTAISLLTVSVVMIAFEAVVPASIALSFAAASFLMPSLMRSIGSCMPITPVEPTSTAFSGICKRPAAVCASSRQ